MEVKKNVLPPQGGGAVGAGPATEQAPVSVAVSHPLELHGVVYMLFMRGYDIRNYVVENVEGRYVIYGVGDDEINETLRLYGQSHAEYVDDIPDADVRELIGATNLLGKIGYYHGALRCRIDCSDRTQCWQYVVTFVPKPQHKVPMSILRRLQAWIALSGRFWVTRRIIPGLSLEYVLWWIYWDASWRPSVYHHWDDLQAVVWTSIKDLETNRHNVYIRAIPLSRDFFKPSRR
jgi:hypothetical protein